jgi:DNA polymerase I
LLLRAYTSLRVHDLRNSKNEPTWGIYGFLNTISYLTKRLEPTHMIVAFDQGRSKRRISLYPGYKANREQRRQKKLKENLKDNPDFPDEFSPQRNMIYSLMDAANICQRMCYGVEADDIIAKIAIDYQNQFDEIIIVSLDHDMLQLIRPNITVLKPSLGLSKNIKEEIIDYESIISKYQLTPEQLPELWALSGDRSDGISGAKGIGPAKSAKLMETYGSLANVLNNDEYIKTQANSVNLAYKLIKLDNQEEFPAVTMEDLKFDPTMPGDFKAPKFKELLDNLEFHTILQDWQNLQLWYKFKIGKKLS